MVRGRGRDLARVVPTDASGIRALYQALGSRRGHRRASRPAAEGGGQRRGVRALLRAGDADDDPAVAARAQDRRAVLFVFVERLPRGRGFRMHWVPAPDGVADADPRVAATALNLGVERCVAICPTQYQWTTGASRRPRQVAQPYPAEAQEHGRWREEGSGP